MSNLPVIRLGEHTSLVSLSTLTSGFAYSNRGHVVLCGYFDYAQQLPRPIAIAVDGPNAWNVIWTAERSDQGFAISIDDLRLQPRGDLRVGDPQGGALVICSSGIAISVNRKLPGEPIAVISPHDGSSGIVPLADALWTDSWSAYGYLKGELVFELHVEPPPPKEEGSS